MSKKMCPNFDGSYDYSHCPKRCPNGYSSKTCEIIPKKPKMVRAKGWVDAFDYMVWKQKKDGVCYLYHDKIEGISCYPVTILIDEKYLRRKP